MHRTPSERGSIPLALLAVIIVAGLASTVLVRVVAEDRSTRFDRNYTVAFHAADAAVEEAYFALNNEQFATGALSVTDSGDANGVPYTWTATRPTATATNWTVLATGTGSDGTTREVRADIAEQPLFEVGAVSMVSTAFNGNNGANSYNSATGAPSHCTWTKANHKPAAGANVSRCTSGKGLIGSNGDMELGNNSYADGVFVFDWAEVTKQYPDRCKMGNIAGKGPLCALPENGGVRRNIDDRQTFDTEMQAMEDALLDSGAGTNCGTGASMPSWTASTDGTPLGGGVYEMSLAPGVYCFARLDFDATTVLPAAVTPDAPLEIVVRDSIEFAGQIDVNCASCNSTNATSPLARPAARRLDIRLPGGDIAAHPSDLPAVNVRKQTHFGGTILAPNATCNAPNGGVDIYGSMVCRDIGNAGNWAFHYDEDLANGATTGKFAVLRWTEQ